ncbi:CHRD domain-containing protein [Nonomuraea sp. NPDC051941]|uniref:CHRD domain-containing protein n=1 Tax=Nonomuraea sp. NPDC051941 TaxID=3364373 RepID=UPI0037C84BE1
MAVAKFRISGDRFYFFVQWRNTGRPTAFHIHRGKAGVNGPVVIDLLSNGRIRGNTASGSVRVKSSLLRDIKNKPKNWYANLHTSQFPDGAVRGQLHKGGRW